MRFFLWLKHGFFYLKRVILNLRQVVLARFCSIVFVVLVLALNVLGFMPLSIFALESKLGTWSAHDYYFFETSTTWRNLATNQDTIYTDNSEQDYGVSVSYNAQNGVTSVGYSYLYGFEVASATALLSVATSGQSGQDFEVLPEYVGQSADVSITLYCTSSVADRVSQSLSSLQFWLTFSDSSSMWATYVSNSQQSNGNTYRVTGNFRVSFPQSKVGLSIVKYDVKYLINMLFSDYEGAIGSIGINYRFDISDFSLSPSQSTVDISTGVESGVSSSLGSLGDAIHGGAGGVLETWSSAEEQSDQILLRAWSLIDPNTIFGGSPSNLFPARLVSALKGIRFMFNYIVDSRPWISNLLQWSFTFGFLAFLLSTAVTVSKLIRGK